MRFSQRIGITEVRTVLQVRSLDQVTRNRLWNVYIESLPVERRGRKGTWVWKFHEHVWKDFYGKTIDTLQDNADLAHTYMRITFMEGKWEQVFDLIEFAVNSPQHILREHLAEETNKILTEELVGVRIVDSQCVEITDETEIKAIEEALATTSEDRFKAARTHLAVALEMLSDRQAPDYRNSIKESISAVEAIARIVTGNPKATLGQALKGVQPPLHAALFNSLSSLYGYTNDASGIRHSIMEESNLDAADAKFMLVTCSAFVVYLIQKTAAAAANSGAEQGKESE